jgi:hypothetical protein
LDFTFLKISSDGEMAYLDASSLYRLCVPIVGVMDHNLQYLRLAGTLWQSVLATSYRSSRTRNSVARMRNTTQFTLNGPPFPGVSPSVLHVSVFSTMTGGKESPPKSSSHILFSGRKVTKKEKKEKKKKPLICL